MENEEMTTVELWDLIPQVAGQRRAEVMVALANKLTYRNRKDALALCLSAVEIYESLGEKAPITEQAEAYVALANVYEKLEQYEQAIPALSKGLELLRVTGFEFEDDLLRKLAEYHGNVGNWQEALNYQLEAVNFNELVGDEEFLAISYRNAADCLVELERLAEALVHYTTAVEIFRKLKQLDEIGNCYQKMAEINLTLGNVIEAIALGEKSLNVAFFNFHSESPARTHLLMMRAYMAQGDLEKAGQYLVDAQGLAQYTGDKNWDLIAEVEQERINHMKASGFDAEEAQARLLTIREMIGG